MTTPDKSGANNSNYKGHMHRKCKQCGEELGSGAGKATKYCSQTCYNVAQRSTDYAKVCLWCGKAFEHRSAKHCSVECAKADRNANLTASGRRKREAKFRQDNNLPAPERPKKPKVLLTCKTCGKGMMVFPSEGNTRKYCSRECYAKAVSERQKGTKHFNYKHGLTSQKFSEKQKVRKHPQYKSWVKSVLVRDNYRCRACDCAGGELHVHHHAPWADAPKQRLRVSNGITLCKECHRLWHLYERKGIFTKKESLLQEKIASGLREYGFHVYNVPGSPYGVHGIPDLMVCYNGFAGGIECKVFPNYLTEIQRAEGERIKAAGGVFYVAQSEDDLGRIIEMFELKSCSGAFVVNALTGMHELETWLEEVTR